MSRPAQAQQRPILVMAGGTGGHVFPALAVARELMARGVPVVWLGTRAGLEAKVVPAAGIPIDWISVAGLRGKGIGRWVRAPFMLTWAAWQALRVMWRRRPLAVLGLGGFVTGPGGLMARLTGKPLCVHEQNARAGLTNRLLARIATRVMEAFPNSFPAPAPATLVTGNPVRREIADLPAPAQRWAQRSGPLQVLVLGGSQGAVALNQTVPAALASLAEDQRPVVRHQVGSRHLQGALDAYREAGVDAQVTAFIDDMAEAYAWADLVVCRSGALTITELAAAGVGSILVPFPHAVDDHQTHNARFLVDAGAAVLVPQGELTAAGLAQLWQSWNDRARLLAMAEAARSLAKVDAARTVADVCLACAGWQGGSADQTEGQD